MPEDWLIATMYATKRRRRTVKSSVKTPAKDPPKSNPSKRHRERLNGELDHLASLLPFEQSVISKLDKLSILRLAVSFLRTKSFFQSVIPARYGIETHLMTRSHLFHEPGFSEGESILQALYGFMFVVTCDGEVFFASRTVEQYLGFHQSDIIHQSVMELIHSEDREEFKRQLSWNAMLPSDKSSMSLHEVLMPENSHHLHRSFTVRFRCLLDNTSGFITLEINGFIRVLHGQGPRTEEPHLALFATCSPFGPLSLFDIPSREVTFKTKHKMDYSPVTMDARGKALFGFTDQDLANVSGYDLIHPDDLNYFSSAHQELIKTGSSGLIAYRWQTKMLQWTWLQSSCKVIYKNSKPDFIICTHRQLTDDEGQDLYGKRGNEFKLPYPLLDIDMCSGFGFGEEELNTKTKTKPSKKKASASNGGMAVGTGGTAVISSAKECVGGGTGSGGNKKSRKSSCGSGGIQSYSPYATGFPGYDGTGEYKSSDILYPYSGNGFGIESDLYRTQSYGAFSSIYPSTDPYRMDVDKHAAIGNPYFIDPHRQYQHPGYSYGTNGYSDFVMSSKYGYDMPKYGFDSYSLDIGKRMDYTDIAGTFDASDPRRYSGVVPDDQAVLNSQNPLHPHHHHHHQHHQNHPHNHQNRYTPPRLTGSSFEAVDLRSSAPMFATGSLVNPIEASVAPPSLFKPVTPSSQSVLGSKDLSHHHHPHHHLNHHPSSHLVDKYNPTNQSLCSSLQNPLSHSHTHPTNSHHGTSELIPSLPLPPLPHSSVIKSTGQPDSQPPPLVLPHPHPTHPTSDIHSSSLSLPLPNAADCLTSYPHTSPSAWSSCINSGTSSAVTCYQPSMTSMATVESGDITAHNSMPPQHDDRMDTMSNSTSVDTTRDTTVMARNHSPKALEGQNIRMPEKEHVVTGIPVSVVKPPSWLHDYNSNTTTNNNNNSSNNNNNNNVSSNGLVSDNNVANSNGLIPLAERDWMDNSSGFYGKSHRVIFPESCHSVKNLGLKPYERGDNPLLSFSEMTHTLMGSTH